MKVPICKKVLKDVNFIELDQVYHQYGFNVLQMNRDDIVRIRKALRSDSLFLQRHNLMDYSLYLAVEKQSNQRNPDMQGSLNNDPNLYEAI